MHRRTWSYCGGLLVLLLLSLFCDQVRADNGVEYQVKAGFLYNFAKFTDWPPGKMGADDSPFVIGVFANAGFMDVLQRAVSGKTVGNHRIVVRRVIGADDAQACDLLYVSNAARDSNSTMLSKARDANVLTVGEGDAFIDHGGIIAFYPEGDKVRFTISRDAAGRADLKLSARLLSVAKIAD